MLHFLNHNTFLQTSKVFSFLQFRDAEKRRAIMALIEDLKIECEFRTIQLRLCNVSFKLPSCWLTFYMNLL